MRILLLMFMAIILLCGIAIAQTGTAQELKFVSGHPGKNLNAVSDSGYGFTVEINPVEGEFMPIKIAELKKGEWGFIVYDGYYLKLFFADGKLTGVNINARGNKSPLAKLTFEKPFEPVVGKQYSMRIKSANLSHELVLDFTIDSSGAIFMSR